MEQLEDNLETFGKFQPLTEAEEEAVEKAADLIRSRVKMAVLPAVTVCHVHLG